MLIKTKAKIENGKLKATVKYPLVGGAELELGAISKLKALVKVPFLYSSRFFGLVKLKEEKKK